MTRTAVRLLEDVLPLSHAHRWHPLYLHATGTPCYHEFVKLSQCLQQERGACEREYRTLIACLREHGLDM